MLIVNYILENRYGNFVPMRAHVDPTDHSGGDDYILFPDASAMACIKLEDAQRFLREHTEADDDVFLLPIKMAPNGINLFSTLLAANPVNS